MRYTCLGWGAGSVADYPWHLDGSEPWSGEEALNVLQMICSNKFSNWISFIDTAFRYGKGWSHRLIGFANENKMLSESIRIVTKVELGTPAEIRTKISYCEAQLKKTPYGILLHNPDLSKTSDMIRACDTLSMSKFFLKGISTEPSREALRYVQEEGLNCIQFPYSINDRRAEDEIFPFLNGNTTVMVNRVLGGPTRDKTMNQVDDAIRFIMRMRASIDVILVGMRNLNHLNEVSSIYYEHEKNLK